jgi:hypothetical protein
MGSFGEDANLGGPDAAPHCQPGSLPKATTRSAHEVETGIVRSAQLAQLGDGFGCGVVRRKARATRAGRQMRAREHL